MAGASIQTNMVVGVVLRNGVVTNCSSEDVTLCTYRLAGNFCGIKFRDFVQKQIFRDLNFAIQTNLFTFSLPSSRFFVSSPRVCRCSCEQREPFWIG